MRKSVKERTTKRLQEVLDAMAQGTHPPEAVQHGPTLYGYGCRCEVCKGANREDCATRRKLRETLDPPAHGLSGYMNWKCRCEVCKKAKAEDQLSLRGRGKGNPPKPGNPKYQNPPQHGLSGYQYYSCRCEICKSANRIESKARYERRKAT